MTNISTNSSEVGKNELELLRVQEILRINRKFFSVRRNVTSELENNLDPDL